MNTGELTRVATDKWQEDVRRSADKVCELLPTMNLEGAWDKVCHMQEDGLAGAVLDEVRARQERGEVPHDMIAHPATGVIAEDGEWRVYPYGTRPPAAHIRIYRRDGVAVIRSNCGHVDRSVLFTQRYIHALQTAVEIAHKLNQDN